MLNRVLLAAGLVLFPFVVLFIGGWMMRRGSGRERVYELLARAAPADRQTPGLRRSYDAAAVQRHWAALDADGLRREKRFLELDLIFPFFFAAAFAISLVLAWQALDRPAGLALLLVPVLAMLLADRTENKTLIRQVDRMMAGDSLQEDQIRIASRATQAKLLLCMVVLPFLVVLGVVLT
jgi:hypothetical protein